MVQVHAQDISTLLATLLQGQGAASGLLNGAQPVDIQGNINQGGFLAALQGSFQELLGPEFDLSQITDPSQFVAQIQALLTQQKAANGNPLPLLQGQALPLEGEVGNDNQSTITELMQALSQLPGEDAESIAAVMKQLQALATPQQLAELNSAGAGIALTGVPGTEQGAKSAISNQQSQRPDNALLNAIVAQRELNDRFAAMGQGATEMPDVVEVAKELPNPLVAHSQIADSKSKESPIADVLKQLYTSQAKNGQEQIDGTQVRDVAREQGLGTLDVRNAFATLKMAMATERFNSNENPDAALNLSGMGSQSRSSFAGVAADARPAMMQSYLSTSVHDPQWQTDFSQRISMMARNGNQTAEIRLNPANLGSVEIRVVMNDDQATVTFNAQHAVVRDAIEASLPRLRDMFNASGLQLADAQVMDEGLFNQQRQHQQAHDNGASPWDRYSGNQSGGDESLAHTVDISHLQSASDLSGIDLFA